MLRASSKLWGYLPNFGGEIAGSPIYIRPLELGSWKLFEHHCRRRMDMTGKLATTLCCCCLTHRLSREQRDGRWCESLDAHGRSVSRSQLSSTKPKGWKVRLPLQGDGGRSLSVALYNPRFPGGWQIETFIYSLPNRRWTGVYVQYAIASLPESKLMALTTNVAIQQADGSGTVDGLGTGNAL